jgi:hypothetical protein
MAMKPVDIATPRMTEDGLAVLLGGRTYGSEGRSDRIGSLKQMGVPKEMDALIAVLTRRSKLLALPLGSAQEAVYGAYGDDLGLLTRYRDAFKLTIVAALRARAAPDDPEAQAFLDRVTEQVAEVVYDPTLDLGPDALRLQSDRLLERLQTQFRADAESLKQAIAVWLHLLAEADYVSIIEWFNPQALRYHFFRMDASRTEVGRTKTTTGDIMAGRTITTTIQDRVEVFSERRVHTVVNASVRTPEGYHGRVPKRIARLLDTIPAEVRPFVTIIDGMVSHEEIHRRVAASKIETQTRSVYIPDPALALFNSWAINGWGGSTTEWARSLYRGHAISTANKILALELIGTAALCLLASAAEGRRGAIVAAIICVTLTFFQQLGMRIERKT